jgi:hypothetical protein
MTTYTGGVQRRPAGSSPSAVRNRLLAGIVHRQRSLRKIAADERSEVGNCIVSALLFHLRTQVDATSSADQKLGAPGRKSIASDRPPIQQGEIHFTLRIGRGKRAVFATNSHWQARPGSSEAANRDRNVHRKFPQ